MRLAAKLAPLNELEVPNDREWVAQTLFHAACNNGQWTQLIGTSFTAAMAAVSRSVTTLPSLPEYRHDVGNGWYILDSNTIGDYHSHYDVRYYVASWGYLALTDHQAMYHSNSAVIEVDAHQALLVRFSGRPLLREEGFWSLDVWRRPMTRFQ